MTRFSRTARATDRRRGGFTIAEMGISAAVTALLMVSIGASIVIATRSLPSPGSQPSVTMTATAGLSDLGDDLSVATRVTEITSRSITFTIADRSNDADSNPEKIRYAWSGVVGDPLTRSYNGGTAVTIVPSVRSLTFTSQTRTSTESYEAQAVETSEFLLKSNDSSSNLNTAHVHNNTYTGQYVLPTLPANSKSWSVTRVQYRAINDNTPDDGTLYVQLRPAASDKRPTLTVLDQASRPETTLSSTMSWYESAFSSQSVSGLAASRGVCIVMMAAASAPEAAQIEYNNSAVTSANAGFESFSGTPPETTSGWSSVPTNQALRYYAYGKAVAVPSGAASLTATRTYLTGVRVTVNPGGPSDNPLDVTFAVGNEPEVAEAAWDTDLSADPTTIDTDGDGRADWAFRTGNSLSTSTFSGGLWSPSGTGALDTNSAAPPTFAGLTTGTVKFRDTTAGDGGVSFRMNVLRSGGLISPIVATLTLQSDGTQTLTLQVCNSSGVTSTIYTCPNLAASLTTVRLMADATQQTVNLRVNDCELGTFGFNRRVVGTNAADLAGASISLDAGGSADVDSVSVHAGRAP